MNNEDEIITLEWFELIRLRPGMFVGKRGDGTDVDDGLYVLMKEIFDNSVDEFRSGFGKEIFVNLGGNQVVVRDYGRGIDFDRLVHFNSNLVNANDKVTMPYHSVGVSQFGLAIVNALSSEMVITSYQRGAMKSFHFSRGEILSIGETQGTCEPDGLKVVFTPDNQIFENYAINIGHLREMLKEYAVCNPGLKLNLGNEAYYAPHGMLNLLEDLVGSAHNHKKIHITDPLCDIAIATASHTGASSIRSFVNGHWTPLEGTHIQSLIDALPNDIKNSASLTICINVMIENPEFNSSTKYKLTSLKMSKKGRTIKQYISKLLDRNLPEFSDAESDKDKLVDNLSTHNI